jgi:hypothetical protein
MITAVDFHDHSCGFSDAGAPFAYKDTNIAIRGLSSDNDGLQDVLTAGRGSESGPGLESALKNAISDGRIQKILGLQSVPTLYISVD